MVTHYGLCLEVKFDHANVAFEDELIIITVWVPAIILEYYYPDKSPGLFQLFHAVSRKLLPELLSGNNRLLPEVKLATTLGWLHSDFRLLCKKARRKQWSPTRDGANC
jgi:hypothetical protein